MVNLNSKKYYLKNKCKNQYPMINMIMISLENYLRIIQMNQNKIYRMILKTTKINEKNCLVK